MESMAVHFGKSFARLEKAVVCLQRFAHFGKLFGRFEGLFAHFVNTAVWFENSIVNWRAVGTATARFDQRPTGRCHY